MTTAEIIITVILGLAVILFVANQARLGLHRGRTHHWRWRGRRRQTEPPARN